MNKWYCRLKYIFFSVKYFLWLWQFYRPLNWLKQTIKVSWKSFFILVCCVWISCSCHLTTGRFPCFLCFQKYSKGLTANLNCKPKEVKKRSHSAFSFLLFCGIGFMFILFNPQSAPAHPFLGPSMASWGAAMAAPPTGRSVRWAVSEATG